MSEFTTERCLDNQHHSFSPRHGLSTGSKVVSCSECSFKTGGETQLVKRVGTSVNIHNGQTNPFWDVHLGKLEQIWDWHVLVNILRLCT